jgi:DNA replication protein DnaC
MEVHNTSTLITTRISESLYDYGANYRSVIKEGKEMFGEKFHFDDVDKPVILQLIAYFLQDEGVAEALGIDLYKGLIITGPVGCGKTSILQIFNAFMPKNRQFLIRSCCNISLDYIEDGHQTIRRYTSESFDRQSKAPQAIHFDDFGLEKDTSHFGNTRNVMADILMNRYDYYMECRMLTYLTTNLKGSEVEERYGLRLRSRIRQMCQLISFSPDSKDKRQ